MHGWFPLTLDEDERVIILNAGELAGISSDEDVHAQFIATGIDEAASHLLGFSCNKLIGLSVGGTIAWRAALQGCKCEKLIAFSATRLRYETTRPPCPVRLIYGENDPFLPKKEWFETLGITFKNLPSKGHDFYMQPKYLENEI